VRPADISKIPGNSFWPARDHLGLSRQGMWRGEIEAVRISATHRSKGFGIEMIGWAVEECRARNCGLVQLMSDKTRAKAVAFYQSLGFQPSHEGFKLSL